MAETDGPFQGTIWMLLLKGKERVREERTARAARHRSIAGVVTESDIPATFAHHRRDREIVNPGCNVMCVRASGTPRRHALALEEEVTILRAKVKTKAKVEENGAKEEAKLQENGEKVFPNFPRGREEVKRHGNGSIQRQG